MSAQTPKDKPVPSSFAEIQAALEENKKALQRLEDMLKELQHLNRPETRPIAVVEEIRVIEP